MRHVRYLWAHQWGRLAALMVLVGALGLTARYWDAMPLMVALRAEV